jgi:hypothetical protein
VQRLVAVALILAAASAHADRSIGRAGVGTASDDGAGALLVNPAGLARRDGTRAQVGVAVVDDAAEWRSDDTSAAVAKDQSASSLMPQAAVEGELGDGWIVGIGFQTAAISARTFASPNDYPADQLMNRFDYRYAGIASAVRRDTLSLGAARRFGDAVALGVAFGGSRIGFDETRSVWAESVLGRAVDPNHDIAVALSASGYAPSAIAGVLVAPPDTRLEVGASLAYTTAVDLSGDYRTADPKPGMNPPGVAAAYQSPSAHLELHQPVTARIGARWNAEHWIAEVDSDLWIYGNAAQAATWDVSGLRVDDTANGASAPITRLPSRVSAQTHGAVRGAVDVELLAGFLWATAGYAYTSAGTSGQRLSPTFGELAGHTGALGLELSAGGFTITLGWARTWSVARSVPTPAWHHDGPFPVTDPALPAGTYDGSRDLVGISIDGELDAPP